MREWEYGMGSENNGVVVRVKSIRLDHTCLSLDGL